MSVTWTQDPGTYAMMERYIRKMTLEPRMQVGCIHTAVIARGCWFPKEIPPFDLFEQEFFVFFFFPHHTWLTMFNTEVKTPGPSSPANVTAGL